MDIRAKQIAPEIQDGLNRIFEEHPYLAGEFVDHVKLQELAEKHGITLHNHLKDTIHDPYGRVSVVLYRFDEIFARLIETGFDPNHYWRFEVGHCIDNVSSGTGCNYHACGGLTNCPDPCTCAVKTFRQHAVQG